MPEQIHIRFYAELNELLPAEQRATDLIHEITQSRSIKDMIEAIGVPHTEVELIIVNGESVDFNYLLRGGEHISVYPAFTTVDISPLKRCQPEPLSPPVFVLDNHLGRLAAYLRMLGFDTLYRNDYDDPELAELSASEQRILLTCDRQLLMRNQVSHGYFVRARDPHKQLREVMSRFSLYGLQKPFTRCMDCNGKIQPVSKQEIETQLLAEAKKYYDKFYQCKNCKKIYWEGSHYSKMKALIDNINNDTDCSLSSSY